MNVRAEFGKELSSRLKEPIKKEVHKIVWIYTDDSKHNEKDPEFEVLKSVFSEMSLIS